MTPPDGESPVIRTRREGQPVSKQSRVRINLGTNKVSDAETKPASRVRIHLRDEAPKDKPASRVRINLGGNKKS